MSQLVRSVQQQQQQQQFTDQHSCHSITGCYALAVVARYSVTANGAVNLALKKARKKKKKKKADYSAMINGQEQRRTTVALKGSKGRERWSLQQIHSSHADQQPTEKRDENSKTQR